MNKFETAFRRKNTQPPVMVKYYRNSGKVKKTYAILMTPRSGSTWLTHEVAAYNVLSYPDEYFNPLLIDKIVEKNGSRNIYECFDCVTSNMASGNGVFGFEITYFSLRELEHEADLLSLMVGDKYFFYLTRKNFVAQAVSLFIAEETGVFHLTNREAPDKLNQRPQIPYDGQKIKFWCGHILQQEYGFGQWIAQRNIEAIPLQYEEMVDDITGTVQKIADHVGVKLPLRPVQNAAKTVRVTSEYAAAYEDRFRSEHTEWCRYWENNRGLKECRFDHKIAEPLVK